MADADLVVVLLDGSENLTAEDTDLFDQVKDLNYLVAINKSDLEQTKIKLDEKIKLLHISAKTGEGLDKLQNAIIEPFATNNLENTGFLISDARHFDLLRRSVLEIEVSSHLIDEQTSEEIILIGLHNALRFLGEITGETTNEDMLTRIFSTFCIGK
jgi:tRNA modification GTPase